MFGLFSGQKSWWWFQTCGIFISMWIDLAEDSRFDCVFVFRPSSYVSFREGTNRTIFAMTSIRRWSPKTHWRKPEIYHCLDCHQALSPLYMENPIPLAPLSQKKGKVMMMMMMMVMVMMVMMMMMMMMVMVMVMVWWWCVHFLFSSHVCFVFVGVFVYLNVQVLSSLLCFVLLRFLIRMGCSFLCICVDTLSCHFLDPLTSTGPIQTKQFDILHRTNNSTPQKWFKTNITPKKCFFLFSGHLILLKRGGVGWVLL